MQHTYPAVLRVQDTDAPLLSGRVLLALRGEVCRVCVGSWPLVCFLVVLYMTKWIPLRAGDKSIVEWRVFVNGKVPYKTEVLTGIVFYGT